MLIPLRTGTITHPAARAAITTLAILWGFLVVSIWLVVVMFLFCIFLWPLIPMTTRAMLGAR